jgi:hypothetical protein
MPTVENLSFNGKFVERDYSGATAGKNNPAMRTAPDIGPTPRGAYQIGESDNSPHTGTCTLNLTPAARPNTFGRSALRIRGDSLRHSGTAFEASGNRRLEVSE